MLCSTSERRCGYCCCIRCLCRFILSRQIRPRIWRSGAERKATSSDVGVRNVRLCLGSSLDIVVHALSLLTSRSPEHNSRSMKKSILASVARFLKWMLTYHIEAESESIGLRLGSGFPCEKGGFRSLERGPRFTSFCGVV
jgi:hypothetical protein